VNASAQPANVAKRAAPEALAKGIRPGSSHKGNVMAYIITEPCIGTKDKSCVDVCPVDCIHGTEEDNQLFIDPEVCIDCGACVSACPVEAIYADADVPDKWKSFVELNAEYFKKVA
jgi:NAD-dependent dihydropyrimidine dehydrogenase PreA subunit